MSGTEQESRKWKIRTSRKGGWWLQLAHLGLLTGVYGSQVPSPPDTGEQGSTFRLAGQTIISLSSLEFSQAGTLRGLGSPLRCSLELFKTMLVFAQIFTGKAWGLAGKRPQEACQVWSSTVLVICFRVGPSSMWDCVWTFSCMFLQLAHTSW